MSKKALLLSASFEVLKFIPERKLWKLLIKEKIEVVSEWDNTINWVSGKIKQPATVRLKNHVKRNYYNSNFSRKALIKRDKSSCQFCGIKLAASEITVDHVFPKTLGGITSFANCVVACQECNGKKGGRTPEQANMKLLKKPTHPSFTANYHTSDPQEFWHPGWDDWLSHS